MHFKNIIVLVSLCLTLWSCESLRTYEGPRRAASEIARISGDLRIRAGAPISIILRRVDAFNLGLRYSGADITPGDHHLLIDCTVTETGHVSRHHLDVNVEAGVRYKLVANTLPGNRECSDVELVED